MTRESRAQWLVVATAALVVLLAALFAVLRNLPAAPAPNAAAATSPAAPVTAAQAPEPPRTAPGVPATVPAVAPAPPAAVDAHRVAIGERAYARLGCATCHSIGGRGNQSSMLDGVGARLDRKALYEMTTGTGAAGAQLGAGLARRKQHAIGDPEMDALLDYLGQLR